MRDLEEGRVLDVFQGIAEVHGLFIALVIQEIERQGEFRNAEVEVVAEMGEVFVAGATIDHLNLVIAEVLNGSCGTIDERADVGGQAGWVLNQIGQAICVLDGQFDVRLLTFGHDHIGGRR